mmetsp:Transcript_15035/g.19774  ORF Transcript_15035/g.19774 Transcript_15035/m.19774 type:complete len:227 (-) Transcript_15035:1233-1913(-)
MTLKLLPNEIILQIVSFGGVDVAMNLGCSSRLYRQTLLIGEGDEEQAQQKLWSAFVSAYYGASFLSSPTNGGISLFRQLWTEKVTPLCHTPNCRQKLHGIRGQAYHVKNHTLITKESYPSKYLHRIACNNLLTSDFSLPSKCWKCDKSSWVEFSTDHHYCDSYGSYTDAHASIQRVYLPSPEPDAPEWIWKKVPVHGSDDTGIGDHWSTFSGYAWKKERKRNASPR